MTPLVIGAQLLPAWAKSSARSVSSRPLPCIIPDVPDTFPTWELLRAVLEAVIVILICLPFAHARSYDALLKEDIFLFRLAIIDT